MKKNLLCAFLLTSLAACHKDEVVLKNIISVAALDDIVVTYGTEFQTIILPAKVSVMYTDKTTEEIAVTFSKGAYDNRNSGTYPLKGELTLSPGTTNNLNLSASISIVIYPLKLKLVSQDGTDLYEYFYDELNRLDHFKVFAQYAEYTYSYLSDNKVTQRLRKFPSDDYPEKYFYNTNGSLNHIDFYNSDLTVNHTLTYSYEGAKISRYDNSDQSVNTLKFREFDYDTENNVSKVSFDFGNAWNYTYIADKKVATPFLLDLADPLNQSIHPIKTFTFVELSSYTSAYTFNDWGYPTEEVRTYPGDENKQSKFKYTYE